MENSITAAAAAVTMDNIQKLCQITMSDVGKSHEIQEVDNQQKSHWSP